MRESNPRVLNVNQAGYRYLNLPLDARSSNALDYAVLQTTAWLLCQRAKNGRGTRIRTSTNRIKIWGATVTLYLYGTSPQIRTVTKGFGDLCATVTPMTYGGEGGSRTLDWGLQSYRFTIKLHPLSGNWESNSTKLAPKASASPVGLYPLKLFLKFLTYSSTRSLMRFAYLLCK